MLEWWLGSGALALLASLFLFAPRLFLRSARRPSLKQDQLEWFRLRQGELEREQAAPALLDDLGLRLLDDEVDRLQDPVETGSGRSLGWVLLPLSALAALVYLQLGGLQDVYLSRAMQSIEQDADTSEVQQLMEAVAARARQRPENLHYQALLGRYYMSRGEYVRARQVYLSLVEKTPDDAALLALAAQAGYLANERVLDDATQILAERALSYNPHEQSALGMLGMAAFERGQYEAAVGYWQRMLAVQEPGSADAELLAGLIATVQSSRAVEKPPVAAEAHSKGVTVRVQLPAGAQLEVNDVLFVFARDPSSPSPMPVAAKRFAAAQLPLEVRLDDAASMAGQQISTLPQVLVIARISRNGQPGEENASWQGQIGPLAPKPTGYPHTLLLSPQKKPAKNL
ncbi:MAG: cytochrome C biogenesis protein [Halieaceae bacterium]|nr:cytochrome C biogenesis protein [Halieaceae bacterium]